MARGPAGPLGNWLQFLLCGVRWSLHLIEQFGSCLGPRCGELQQNVGKVLGKRFETGLARPRIRRLAQLGTALSTCRQALETRGCRAGQGKVTRCPSGFSELYEQDRGLQANTRVRNPHCSPPGCATHPAKTLQLAPLSNLCSFFPAVSLPRLVLIAVVVSHIWLLEPIPANPWVGAGPVLMGPCCRTWAVTTRSTPTRWRTGAASATGTAPPATPSRRRSRTARGWVRVLGTDPRAGHP